MHPITRMYHFYQWLDTVVFCTVLAVLVVAIGLQVLRQLRNPFTPNSNWQAWRAKERENWGFLYYLFAFYNWLAEMVGLLGFLYLVYRQLMPF